MSSFTISVNGQSHSVEAEPDTPMLWILRDHLGLIGTKFGCGVGQCGACTIHLNGAAVRACQIPVSVAQHLQITTIEGLAEGAELSAIQKAWAEEDVPQCGYCQAGQIMSATALLANNPDPDDEAIDSAMSANLCRCGTYERIRHAIKSAAAMNAKTEAQ